MLDRKQAREIRREERKKGISDSSEEFMDLDPPGTKERLQAESNLIRANKIAELNDEVDFFEEECTRVEPEMGIIEANAEANEKTRKEQIEGLTSRSSKSQNKVKALEETNYYLRKDLQKSESKAAALEQRVNDLLKDLQKK
ncbi:hypothetical protein C0995_011907 [Termitomyces sp. Mi166|nr:hypothetical protein C0995_011907 [Termitomyces sp. Mi166\